MQLRHLRCFVAVAQERHLARAAERLALSQPAVSKTLAELEELAGARLVERGSAGRRGIQGFTAAGEHLLAHALRVLEALDASARGGDAGLGRAAAAASHRRAAQRRAFACCRRRWPRLRERLPTLQVQVQTGANAPLLDALRAGELDLVAGRMSDPQLMTGLTFELLYTEPLAIVARGRAIRWPAARRRCRTCWRYPLVVYGEGTIPRHHTESFLSGLGLRLPAHVTQTLDLSVARALLVRSDAVWFTPIGAACDDLASGHLVRLAIDTAGTEEPVGLLLRSDAEPSAARQALIALLREAGADQSRVARR